MATAAVGGGGIGGEVGFHSRFGMASATLCMSGEGCVVALCIKVVAKSAVGPKARFRIDPALWIDVHRVRELEQNGPLLFVSGKRQQVRLAACGRERGMALGANFGVQVGSKGVLMAGHALIVPGAL